jgi:DNA-binding LytR/AlgR family response regulator
MKILFMDDDEGNRGLIPILLRKRGFDVIAPEFFDAEEGLTLVPSLVEKENFDAVVLDLNWDTSYSKDGMKAVRSIKDTVSKLQRALPIITIWSANAESLSAEEVKEVDCVIPGKGTKEAADIIAAVLREEASRVAAYKAAPLAPQGTADSIKERSKLVRN